MSKFLKYLIVFLISMVPLIELRGAVPIGATKATIAGLGIGGFELPWHWTLIVAIIGNCIPIPFILLFINVILKWMRGCKIKLFNKTSNWLFKKAEKNRPKIEKYAVWGLFLFVAIPLPGTGAWTGALVASVFDMKKLPATVSIFAGVVTAGIIMTLLTQVFNFVI